MAKKIGSRGIGGDYLLAHHTASHEDMGWHGDVQLDAYKQVNGSRAERRQGQWAMPLDMLLWVLEDQSKCEGCALRVSQEKLELVLERVKQAKDNAHQETLALYITGGG